MNRLNGDVSDSERFLVMLDKLQERDVDSYNESGWLVENYKKDYYTLMNHAREMEGKNLLKGEKLKALTPLDEDYSDISIITDGLLGMPSNYHNGHLITTPEKKTEISIPYMPGASKLIVWLSYLPGYKIYLPESVSLAGGGVQKVTVNPTYPKEYTGHYPVEFQIPENATGPFILTLTKDPEKRSMAIEEIEMF